MKMNMLMSLTALLFTCLLVNAQDELSFRKAHFNLESGLAIQGYDPVAYHTANKALKGTKENALVHKGVIYYFASAANKEAFKNNPGKYEPAYGGWCAYAMGAKGEKVSIDPKTFKVVDGHLYLFYNKYFNNTLTDWNKDEPNLKRKADAHWEKLIKQ